MQKDFIEFLKSRASPVDVFSKYVKLTRKGKDWFCRCPFHSEKTGSFKVNPESGLYYCFGCGAHGDMIKFVMEMEKMTFAEAVKSIAEMYGIRVPEHEEAQSAENMMMKKLYLALEIISDYFSQQIVERAGTEALSYLKERNVSAESIEKFKLGFATNEAELIFELRKNGLLEDTLVKTGVFFKSSYKNELNDKFSGRITFPIIDYKDRCVGFGGRIIKKSDAAKYINSPETDIFIKNQQLYGYHIAKRSRSKQIILVEGYLDVISMHQAGFDGTVAPLGTAISEHQINMCWKMCDNPVIALDGDNAGLKASFRWIDKILPTLQPGKSFKFARLPQDSDPDSLILNDQSDIIYEAVQNAISLSDWMWEGAFLLYPSETPEQKAAIIKMLFEKIDLIKDASIKKLYAQYVREREGDLYRYSRHKKGFTNGFENEQNGAVAKTVSAMAPVRAAIPMKEKIEKILVVTIIKHPYIIDRIIEEFTKLDFRSPSMVKLKNDILNIYNKYYVSGEYEAGQGAIRGLVKFVADAEADISVHAKFLLKEDVSEDDVVSGWLAFSEKYLSGPAMAEDLHNAAVSLRSDFSESNWNRLKALKKSTLLTLRNRRK